MAILRLANYLTRSQAVARIADGIAIKLVKTKRMT